ncbi:hypothetical protein [Nocardioides sp.]|uniref:hypothetical protein n=1 Tax=Nocardioides sp. TaxID=35761 RepID=UPI0039E552CB
MTTLTRGRLPASVYWRRRLVLLTIVLLLVAGAIRLFGGSGNEAAEKGAPVSATTRATYGPSAPTQSATVVETPVDSPVATPEATPTAPATSELPAPTGKCSDDDVIIAPSVPDPQATKPVLVNLTLRTEIANSCLWQISPESVQLRITSGKDRIWSTIDCATAVPDQVLVLRRETDTTVGIKWNARRSDEECSKHTAWALPGFYHVTVSPLGGEPTDLQFELTIPHDSPSSAATDAAASVAATAAATDPADPAATAQATPSQGTKAKKKGKKRANLG